MKLSLPFVLSAAFLLGCGPHSTIGFVCATSSDCDRGQECLLAWPGGYCSKGCDLEGTSRACPADSACTRVQEGLQCAALCEQDADCREGYRCGGVSGVQQKTCRP